MKINKLFTKVIAAVAVAAVTITSIVAYNPQKVQADGGASVYCDENAEAYIKEDGSGYIILKKEFTAEDPLTEICGMPLKNIITFNDGGYIDSFYTRWEGDLGGDGGDIIAILYPYVAHVHGRGPEGLFSGYGYLHFTDETNDTYDLSIWRHAEAWHQVRYNSDSPKITKISWNS